MKIYYHKPNCVFCNKQTSVTSHIRLLLKDAEFTLIICKECRTKTIQELYNIILENKFIKLEQ